jgi:hypothetical protein
MQAANNQQCDCSYNNTPGDQQANTPERQKEIQQQTDWKYLITEKQRLAGLNDEANKHYNNFRNPIYLLIGVSSIFRPPCN